MRVLLTYYAPLDESLPSRYVRDLATQLLGHMHEVRLVTAGHVMDSAVAGESVGLSSTGGFSTRYQIASRGGERAFGDLSDAELAGYRHEVRRTLDEVIDRWNPDVIHTQHVGVHAQLALETGVPYVCTAWEEELDLAASDPRYARLVEQAVENAGRILVSSAAVQKKLTGIFSEVDANRLILIDVQQLTGDALSAIYQAVLDERLGSQ